MDRRASRESPACPAALAPQDPELTEGETQPLARCASWRALQGRASDWPGWKNGPGEDSHQTPSTSKLPLPVRADTGGKRS